MATRKNKLTTAEINLIKKKIGIPATSPLLKCIARSHLKVRKFEAAGDFSHSSEKHWCLKCSCSRVAGAGTDHYGWGWCKQHGEQWIRKDSAEAFAIAHLSALQSRNPAIYTDQAKWFAGIDKDGNLAKGRVELGNEVMLLRGEIMRLLQLASSDDPAETLIGAYDSDGAPVGITDVQRMDMMVKAARAVSSIEKERHKIESDAAISWDSFLIWFQQLGGKVKELFPDRDDQAKFVNIIREIKYPDRGV